MRAAAAEAEALDGLNLGRRFERIWAIVGREGAGGYEV